MKERMISCLQFALLMFCAFLPAQAYSAETALVETRTHSGSVVGILSDDIAIFRGIPYAAPPVGELRFAPTKPVAPWTEPLDCTEFGATAVQKEARNGLPMREDCLTLNVWTPALPKTGETGEKLPVYVYIHGGAYAQGSGSDPLYDGTAFAKRGIVAVTINYRLNVLGFFASKETLSRYGTTGNWGHLDQIEALKWIRENAASFGGDPDRVTIGGESAGSYSVSALMLSPLAEGLFQGAILESGTILALGGSSFYSKGSPERSAEVFRMMSWLFEARDDADGLAKMRAADADIPCIPADS